ncbi:M24 family metallopeptidase [Sphingosinicella soli]|uniref:Xaa-Pro aminopeptidase n=1 Tax=Sphingosinicella soli TaxID=333708 RepID=A0A7W7B585_9SPHN|nr:M24 family metallopeptidase [Sphingosinicella soli]MBB4633393.1 Xaa-Pro aminopeptidase [Sphingosinicella soli]
MADGSYPPPLLPKMSIAERDRRWARVRSLMRRDGIDLILALNNSSSWDQGNGNGRYLSSVGGNCASVSVVFPLTGDVTAITGPVPAPSFWLQAQNWVTDIRTAFFNATPDVIARIGELGLKRTRIGIAGLEGVAREPDGLVSQGAMAMLRDKLPRAEFVNATALMYEARVVKSEEEISLLTKAARMVETAFDVLVREGRPGVPESIIYARMLASLIEQGSEPSSLLLLAAGNPLPPFVGTLPSLRPLEKDDAVLVEVDAKWCGYLGHGAMTHWASGPDAIAREMAELQYEATRQCWAAMKPGNKLADLVGVCAKAAAGTPYICSPIAHSRGLGLDAPVLVNRPRDEWTANWVIEENSVFVVKPTLATADGRRKIMWGDTVVVRTGGAERLGQRPALPV